MAQRALLIQQVLQPVAVIQQVHRHEATIPAKELLRVVAVQLRPTTIVRTAAVVLQDLIPVAAVLVAVAVVHVVQVEALAVVEAEDNNFHSSYH